MYLDCKSYFHGVILHSIISNTMLLPLLLGFLRLLFQPIFHQVGP
jgi:hypothetical protein